MACFALADGGEVEVDEGGLETAVAEVGGELVKLDAAFQHVGGVAVTQGVAAEVLVFFVEAALRFGEVDGEPDASFAHGLLVIVEGLAQGDAGALPSASDAGEKPRFIAVDFPEGAEAQEEFGADGDFACAPSFGVIGGDANDEALTIDVLWSDVDAFGKA